MVGIALSARIASSGPILDQRWALAPLIGAWWASFGLGMMCLRRCPARTGLVVVAGVALGLRVAALAGGPVLSDDLYRYAWDARVQAAEVNPYRYAPDDVRLAGLRDRWLWPDDAACAELDRPPGCTRLNRAAEPTIYPPLAEAWFATAAWLLPSDAEDRGWQGMALAADLVLVTVVALALRAWGHDLRWVAMYAWSPIAVLESVQSGHVDAVAITAALGALWAARSDRPVLAGILLGAAALTKLYPVLLVPVVARRHPVRSTAALVATVAIGYAPHVVAVGWEVLGYLPGYLVEEGYAEGSRFVLVGLTGASGWLAKGLVAAGLAVAAWRAWTSPRPPEAAAASLVGVALLLATPVQPWYALLLVAVATLARAWWWVPLAAAGYPLYLATIFDGPDVLAGRVGYGLAAAMVAAGAWWHRRGAVTHGDDPVVVAGAGLGTAR